MIINPILPIWLMATICVILIILLRKTSVGIVRQILISILLFLINLRIMIPTQEPEEVKDVNVDVLFVVDNTMSMLAEDYDGDGIRMDAVKEDISYIMEELEGARFSVISFGNRTSRLAPYTDDIDYIEMVIACLNGETEYGAFGTDINKTKDEIKKAIDNEYDNMQIVFFISDGELTSGEELESFSKLSDYIDGGAVLGYGTEEGGPMYVRVSAGSDDMEYLEYWDEDFNCVQAISKIDEDTLEDIAEDLDIEYVHMTKTSKINDVLDDIRDAESRYIPDDSNDDSDSDVSDINATETYYYFVIPLIGLLVWDYIVNRRKL